MTKWLAEMFYRFKKAYKDFAIRCLGEWRYFKYDNVKHEIILLREHYNEHTSYQFPQKTIIYMANGFCVHAGLSDRFKGITALFSLSKELHVDFKIYHKHPFNLADYVVPNKYDWYVSPEQICYDKRITSVNYFMIHPLVQKQIDSGEIIDLEREWVSQRISVSKYNQMHFYTNMYPQNNIAFGNCFRELFKPSPKVEHELNYHLQQIGGKYVSVSFRFMQLLGDFKDCDGSTLPVSQQEELIIKSINVLSQIKERCQGLNKILVTADSTRFLNAVRIIPFVYVIEGKVGHINFVSSDEVNMKTFLDFFMISRAEKVFLAKTGKMYNSDFSRRAAMAYNKPFELICY